MSVEKSLTPHHSPYERKNRTLLFWAAMTPEEKAAHKRKSRKGYSEWKKEVTEHRTQPPIFLETMCGRKNVEVIGNIYENPELLTKS